MAEASRSSVPTRRMTNDITDLKRRMGVVERMSAQPIGTGGGGGGAAGLTKEQADGYYINIDGDTMTGKLTLYADPATALEAVTKQYVDARVFNQAAADVRYIQAAGDAMTGTLLLSGVDSVDPNAVMRRQWLEQQLATRLDAAQGDVRYVNITGDTLTGELLLAAPDSTNPSAAMRKSYIDTQVATRLTQAQADNRYVELAGDTMTGNLILPAAVPTLANQAVTKAYVDAMAGGETPGGDRTYVRLRLTAADDVLTDLHALSVGTDAASELRMDPNELVAVVSTTETRYANPPSGILSTPDTPDINLSAQFTVSWKCSFNGQSGGWDSYPISQAMDANGDDPCWYVYINRDSGSHINYFAINIGGPSGQWWSAYEIGTYLGEIPVQPDPFEPMCFSIRWTTEATCEFFVSYDDAETWIQIASRDNTGVPPFSPSVHPIRIGSGYWESVASPYGFNGHIYWVRINEGPTPMQGTETFRFDAADAPGGVTDWTDPRGRSWHATSPDIMVLGNVETPGVLEVQGRGGLLQLGSFDGEPVEVLSKQLLLANMWRNDEKMAIGMGSDLAGIGTQDGSGVVTEYFRSTAGFAWYHRGYHTNSNFDPGGTQGGAYGARVLAKIDPLGRLVLPSTSAVTLTSMDHGLQVSEASPHMAFDPSTIQVRDGSPPYLKPTVGTVTLPDPGPMPATFTIVAKVRGPNVTGASTQAIAGQWETATTRSWLLRLYRDTNYTSTFVSETGSAYVQNDVIINGQVRTNWRQIAVNYAVDTDNNADSYMQNYISFDDGRTWSSAGSKYPCTLYMPFDTSDVVAIGRAGPSNPTVWDGEIAWVECRAAAGPTTGTVIWRFDASEYPGGGVTTWTDPRGHTWTVTNAAAMVMNPPLPPLNLQRLGGEVIVGPGGLTLPGNPTLALQAAPKQYVDTQVATKLDQATADGLYVNTAGDEMIGSLVIKAAAGHDLSLRSPDGTAVASDTPYLSFYNTALARLGVLQGRNAGATDPGMRIIADGNQPIRFFTAGSDTMLINPVTAGEMVKVIGGTTNYIGIYEGATRRGYVGMYPAGHMTCWADTGYLRLGSTAVQPVIFFTSNAERARIDDAGHFCFGQTAPSLSADGNYVHFVNSSYNATNSLLNQPLLITNKLGAGNAAGADVAHFRMAGTTRGSITHPTTTTTSYATSSDYRLKDVLGPVEDPIARLLLLKPWHVRWKENGEEQDTFIAHEVAEVVPIAVTGAKDAVTGPPETDGDPPEGEIIPQQLDASSLIPLLVAAVQELSTKVDELDERLVRLGTEG